jgi:LysM repeat protein
MWKIAKRYYTTVEDIVKVNDMVEPENITPGMKLIIPKRI